MSMEVDEDPAPLLPPAPPQYTLAIADAVIFYSPDDGDMVDDFHDRTIKAMEEAGCPVTMYLHDHIRDQGTELQSVSKVCDIAVQHWFYITDNFCRDKTMMLHKDEQIMNSLMNNNSFIPIWTKPKEEFSDLPYGIKAYTGLYETDFPRFVRRVKSMFRRRDHQDMKQAIQEKQRMEKEQWEKEETVRTTEKNRLLKEQHEKRMEDIRMAVRASLPPDRSLPRTDEEWTYQYGLQQQKHTPRRQRSSPTAADAAIPEYLLSSLSSARSSVSSHHPRANVVYNINIHQPQNVTIGGAVGLDVSDSGNQETALKNIMTDADNPKLNLSLTEHEPPLSRPVQESSRETSGSSFEPVSHSPSEEQGAG